MARKKKGMKVGCKTVTAKGRKVRICKSKSGKVRFAKM